MREHIFIFYFLLCYLFIYTQAEDQYLEFYLTNFTYFNFYNLGILLFITFFLNLVFNQNRMLFLTFYFYSKDISFIDILYSFLLQKWVLVIIDDKK